MKLRAQAAHHRRISVVRKDVQGQAKAKSLDLGGLGGPGRPSTFFIFKGGFAPPIFLKVSRPSGAAQTLTIQDFLC